MRQWAQGKTMKRIRGEMNGRAAECISCKQQQQAKQSKSLLASPSLVHSHYGSTGRIRGIPYFKHTPALTTATSFFSSRGIATTRAHKMLLRNVIVAAALVFCCILVFLFRPRAIVRSAAPAAVSKMFDSADRDHDGLLSRTEFASTLTIQLPVPVSSVLAPERVETAPQLLQTAATPEPLKSPAKAETGLPQCSLLFFYVRH